MKIEIIIREIQKIQEKRDLYYSRSMQAEETKSVLEKQVSKQNGECEALRKLVDALKADSNIKKQLYVSQQSISDNLKKELSERKAEIEINKKTISSMQKTIDDLKRKLDFKGRILKKRREQITSIERKCQEKDIRIYTLIDVLGKPKSESACLNINNPAGTIVFKNTLKADQFVGIPESGSQVIHTNNK